MPNLGDVFQLVSRRFNDRPLPRQLVREKHETAFHVGSEFGNQLLSLFQQLLELRLGQIAFVTERVAEQAASQLEQQFDIMVMRRGQATSKQLTELVNR